MKKYILIIISLLLIGCANNANIDLESMNEQWNGEYKISHIIVGNETIFAPENATLEFKDNRIYGNTGCNNYFSIANWIKNGSLKVAYAGSTKKMCHEKDINDFENIYLGNLEGEFEMSLEDDKYTLKNDNISIFLEKLSDSF